MTRARLCGRRFRPAIEPLEDRQLLSTCHVSRLGDFGAGTGFRGDLRYCITKVNAEPGPDVIDFQVAGTISVTKLLPNLSSEIEIQGPGDDLLTIRRDSAANFRILSVTGGPVSISGVTIRNGSALSVGGGGILNTAVLTIRESIIAGNEVANAGSNLLGGGIYNSGTLTVLRSTITGNAVGNSCSAARGGGIYNSGLVMLIDSTVSDNRAQVENVCFGPALGGGVYNSGTLAILNSTISGNIAHADFFDGWSQGGGVFNQATAVVRHSTIANNSSTHNGGGVSSSSFGTLRLRNTIIAGNELECMFCGDDSDDISAALLTSGYNLIGKTTGASGFAPTDILNVDPKLGPLQGNGGPTQTMALLPGSPAIDAGDSNPDNPPEWDQRGPSHSRIVNGRLDIGAFEVQATEAPASGANGVSADIVAALTTATFDEDELW